MREVPAERWNADAWYDAEPAAPAKMSTKWGAFVGPIDGFDPGFFGILPREAEKIDPQQRMFLEVAIEALDDAGIPRERLRGSRSGVFVASYHSDYAHLQYADLETIDSRTLTGPLHSVIPNRLSHFLDLRGPSLSIDTACSSSLVAIHLACQSLRTGESDLAVAGGVSLMITPGLMISLSKFGVMSPDGRCKTFDARADGFGRGEGCGVLVLKRLADAISDDDRVLAVIRGSAVNQDGHSTLLAAPNGQAQQALIREALANAQLSPSRIGYVEAHGTGTALGDPIEVEAIAATVGRPAPGAGPCLLGAAKANIGHLEAAAGVVGVIKAVLALGHGAVPGQIGFSKLNPLMSLEGTRLEIPRALTPWRRGDQPRCAAVSSFGVGGTNAHVILEERPELPAPEEDAPLAGHVLPLSAQSSDALRALAGTWNEVLARPDERVEDLCYTAAERRSHYDWRLAIAGATKEELRARLAERLAEAAGAPLGRQAAAPPRVAFVFSGQGPQWFAMGRELFEVEPVFREAVAQCDALLKPLAGWSLLAELGASEQASRVDQTEVAQPALFAIQVGLAALWRSWGLAPEAVTGHSVGEIAALHVAGVLDLAEAIRVVFHRAKIMQEATGLGQMAQVSLPEAEALEVARPYGERLSVAAINGPRTAVLSGESAALVEALAALTARGVAHRMLPVKYAFHSAQMAPFAARLVTTLGAVRAERPAIATYSTVSGALASEERFDAAYFGRNVGMPVRFLGAIEAMSADGVDAFVEIGPHPVLSASISEALEARKAKDPEAKPTTPLVLASLRRARAERETMLAACAKLYEAGWAPDFPALQRRGSLVALPAYPWQRKRYWIRAHSEAPAKRAGGHPILGHRVPAAGVAERIFEGTSERAASWLADHRIFGRTPIPAAAVLEALLVAARDALGESAELRAFTMREPLFLPEGGGPAARWQTVVSAPGPGRAELTFYLATPDASPEWRTIATAEATAEPAAPATLHGGAPAVDPVEPDAVYAQMRALGVEFGPFFRCLRDVRRGPGVVEARVELPEGLEEANLHALHPVLLDAALQLCNLVASSATTTAVPERIYLPVGVDRFGLSSRPRGALIARARMAGGTTGSSITCDVTLEAADLQGAGAVTRVATLEGMHFARADASAFAARAQDRDDVYEVAWRPLAPAAIRAGAKGAWLVLADRGGFADDVARAIDAAGGRSVRVAAGSTFARTGDEAWTVDAASPSDLERVLAECAPGEPLRGALHLWSLDASPLEAATAAQDEPQDALCVASVLHLVQALARRASGAHLALVSRGAEVVSGEEPGESLRPRAGALRGLASVIALEHPELAVRHIDVDPAGTSDDAATLAAELLSSGARPRSAALRARAWSAPRLERHKASTSAGPVRVELVRPGTLDGIELKAAARAPLAPGEVRLRVQAAALNFRDVLVTLGMYPGDPVPLGVECAGVVTEVGPGVTGFAVGSRAFGYAPKSLGTEATVPAAFLAPLPARLNAVQAASIPVAFLTAYYGLHRLARMARGQRVLIHAAAGGVGLAAVQLARQAGAEIFATAGSPEKREMLRRLGVPHVMDSRSLAFADQVREITAGLGVHIVLNSLAGDFIPASLGVLGAGGAFLEIGKRGVMTDEEAARARPDVRYHLYDLGAAAHADHALLRPMLDALLAGLERGELQPLPTQVFPLERTSDAMRFMAQAKHVGKVVVRPRATVPPEEPLVSSAATYWITGGLGGIGLETAKWLAKSGAKSLVLTGRSAPSAAASDAIRAIEATGTKVRVAAADAGDAAAMGAVLDDIVASLPPLRGVVHAAGVVDDAVLVHQTWDRARGVLRGKAHGARVLHALTRDLPLDFFVLYSAAGVLLGAPGQGPYAAANAELDALALARKRLGLPALSVAWGAWADVGMAAALASRGPDVWAARGLGKIEPAAGFAQLERLLREDATYAAVMPMQWPRFFAQLGPEADRSFFAALEDQGQRARPATAAAAATGPTVVEELRTTPAVQRRARMIAFLTERALHVIGKDPSTPVSPKAPLREAGLDSLMAVELRNALARAVGKPLQATLLFDYPTLDALADHLIRVLALAADPQAERIEPKPASSKVAVDGLAELSDQEAEALLLEELEAGAFRSTHGA